MSQPSSPISAAWTLDQTPSLVGKTIVITGANSGLGFEAARVFARAGAQVVLACRSLERARQAAARIQSESPRACLVCLPLDLSRLDSIRAFASTAKQQLERIDVLCNNAGAMQLPFQSTERTADGFEMQFGVNHLGHFALTGLLLDKLAASAAASAPARVVTVSSMAHRLAGAIRYDGHYRFPYTYGYGASKLANLLFAFELDRRLRQRFPGVISVACHPGFASSNLFTNSPEKHHAEAWWMTGLLRLAQPVAQGALPMVYAAVGADIQGGDFTGPGGFFETRGLPRKVHASAQARDPREAQRLWRASEEWTGVFYL